MADTSKGLADRKKPGAEHHNSDMRSQSESWLRHHQEVAASTWQRLVRSPASTLMALAVLAIALALPGFLSSVLVNAQQLTAGWQDDTRLSLYLHTNLSDDEADSFSRKLLLRDDIAAVDYISREQGLREFKRYSGFGDLLDSLEENPLPAAVIVQPKAQDAATLGLLRAVLEDLPEVEYAMLDMEWLQRLAAILQVSERLITVLGLLLGLAVLLVVGNVIKVEIEGRRDEIVVSKLVGATDAWVRRPFLYTGLWYGLLGAVLAWLIIQLAWLMLKTPLHILLELYGSRFDITGFGWQESLMLLSVSLLLGWVGAWIAIRQHLKDIEPR